MDDTLHVWRALVRHRAAEIGRCTLDGIVKRPVFCHIWHHHGGVLPSSVAGGEDLGRPGGFGSVTDGAAHTVAGEEDLVDNVGGDVPVGASDENKGALGEGSIGWCELHDGGLWDSTGAIKEIASCLCLCGLMC